MCRRLIRETRELRFEARGETIERLLDERVGRPCRDVSAGARCEQVPGYRVARLFTEPILKHLDRMVDLAERVVRQGQQPSRFRMLRTECDDLREAESGFPPAPQAVEQNAEVVVRI